MSMLLVVSALLWAGQAAKAAGPALPLVYVTTSDQGGADDLKGRQQSVKDLRAALSDKKKHLVVVDQEDRADFVVDVIERTTTIPKILFTPMQPGVAGPVSSGPSRAVHLRVTIVRGSSDPTEFTNKGTAIESRGGWNFAADDIAKQIDKWIVDQAKARLWAFHAS
jgi:hypothetical protein